ncbi:MAG: HAMP domain-containing histidine kinase [Gammaproteobacteria bacterium]|nr:HAMP domain-containing histidine kinase [Gammaproteobacteria bacterium]
MTVKLENPAQQPGLISHMSHELRSPLNAIIGFSELLREGVPGELNVRQTEYVDDIIEAAKRLLSLVNDVVDLSRIEAGSMQIQLEPVNFPELFDNTKALIRERALVRGISLRTGIADDVGLVEVDGRALKKVLFDLLSNAIESTPEDGTVSVSVTRDNEKLRVRIMELEPGITGEHLTSVLPALERLLSGKESEEGLRNLALATNLVELHGGTASMASWPGQGRRIELTIPCGRLDDGGENDRWIGGVAAPAGSE